MDKIIECVPNFSEGRDMGIIEAITSTLNGLDSVVLLDVDPGEATNRTVVTFIGSPEGVKEGAFLVVKAASELIDMRNHSGAHARMGATDVCPFVPVSGVTMEDCIKIAEEVGNRIGKELGIPVYLYEKAARREEWQNLAIVRSGEYEGLKDKLKDSNWKPDFGPVKFNAKSGATAVGAREFLIAYNVNLNTKNRKLASDIALDIREQGRAKRDSKGKIVRDKDGTMVKVPGKLKECKAVGWVIEEYQKAQVSINLTNYHVTPPHVVFETIREEARKRGLRVTGSEIVGLIPLEAMLEAGKFYLQKQGGSLGIPESEIVRTAIESLGLNEVANFDPHEKIIEYKVKTPGELMSMKVTEFTDELSSDSPAPGGGSVSALAGSLAGALVSMVAALTHGKKGMEELKHKMDEIGTTAQNLKDRLSFLVDEDTRSFNDVMTAMRMKKKTDDQKEARKKAIEEATKKATEVPLEVAELCYEVLKLSKIAVEKGNPNSVSDAGVAAESALTGVRGARLNVMINLSGIEDEGFCKSMKQKVDDLEFESVMLRDKVSVLVEEVIQENG